MRNGDVSLRFAPFDMTVFGIKESEGKCEAFSFTLFSFLPNRRHFVAEHSEARNLVIFRNTFIIKQILKVVF